MKTAKADGAIQSPAQSALPRWAFSCLAHAARLRLCFCWVYWGHCRAARGMCRGLTLVVAAVVVVTPRMQRFVTLEDTDYVARRVHGSINQNFITLAIDYPMGNGLGGGGTSLPYFLQDRVRGQIVLENEYARLMAELGIPGLALWLGFILWLAMRPTGRRSSQWYEGRWLARLFCLISFATAPLGLGMLDAIPCTEMLLMLAGWFAAPEPIFASNWWSEHSARRSTVETATPA